MTPIRKLQSLEPIPWLETLLRSSDLRGERGERGERGADGKDGERGPMGLQGERGADGRDGVDGRDGAPGERGLRGERGEMGEQGKRGLKGQRGLRGLQGKRGKQGLKGEKGDKGDKGDPPKHQIDQEKGRIRFERADGTWGAWVEIKQIVKHESFGGGGVSDSVLQDIKGLQYGGFPEYTKITVTTADLTLNATHRVIVCKSNAMTITLPPAATYYSAKQQAGITYHVANDKANTNDVTLAADGSELIDDANTWTVPPGATPKVVTDGSKWHII